MEAPTAAADRLGAAEGNLWLYEVQAGTAAGVRQAIEAGAHARYLYVVTI